MPIISVVIPVYNGEKTIRETIESVLEQTFQDVEIIVVNDGSQDKTLEIVDSIKDPRIKVFSYPNAGPSPSRNRGISPATGEYIAFLDADDLWKPDKLEAQLKALQANPQAALAYSWTDYIDESGQFLRQGAHITISGDVYKHLVLSNFLDSGSNPLIRSHALAEVGGFDESLTHAEDWDLWLRLASRYPFVVVRSPHILYRTYGTSNSSNLSKLEAGSLPVINRTFAQSPSLGYLKQTSIANLYNYLIFKALEEPPVRHKGLLALRFLWKAVSNDPSLIQKQIIWKVLLKIAIVVLLPPQQALVLLTKRKRLSNLDTLLLSNRLEPF
ncbi:glycosyltransferase [Microcoleus sp. FACHB-SPT15]|uniref:glycosyltransferase n=1 Tax=Microcoleus sp. FACHB-SPT15 TaxID=2692830 RepID=UPI00177B9A8E|nr:glycosyltransferase [Microcoleus sp. FACHB-SPT15]MBD1806880.1 glycosyltransferase [Microcoleus sp. FACHB-SPT15]